MPRCSAACQKRYQSLSTELRAQRLLGCHVAPVAWHRLRLLQGLQGMETERNKEKQRETDGSMVRWFYIDGWIDDDRW